MPIVKASIKLRTELPCQGNEVLLSELGFRASDFPLRPSCDTHALQEAFTRASQPGLGLVRSCFDQCESIRRRGLPNFVVCFTAIDHHTAFTGR